MRNWGRGTERCRESTAPMPLLKSSTIRLRGFASALRLRISTTACDDGVGPVCNRAGSLGVAPQRGKPAPTPGCIGAIPLEKKIPRNFNQTKLRGPLESTKHAKKEAKTKLSEAEDPSEAAEACRRAVRPTLSAIWKSPKGRKPGQSKPQGLRQFVVGAPMLPGESRTAKARLLL